MRENEDGLTLVEMLVALMVVAFAMMAMASVAITSLHAIQGSERTTRATAVGNEVLERLIAIDYDLVGLYEDEVSGTMFEGEELVLLPAPTNRDERVARPAETVERDGIEYSIETAITWVDDPVDAEGAADEDGAQDYKRIVADVTWEVRGDIRSRRVQTLRAPEPQDQMLNIVIEPDQVGLMDSNGKNSDKVFVTVFARVPQSSVKLEYVDRGQDDANPVEVPLGSSNGDDTEWSTTFQPDNVRTFANGETLFTITGTARDGAKESTTIGRGLFLHNLDVLVIQDQDFADDADGTAAFTEQYDVSILPDGTLCNNSLEIYAHVRGGLVSDPVSAILHEDGTPHGDPSTRLQPPTVLRAMDEWSPPDGARFHRTVTTEASLVAGNRYDLTVFAERAADGVTDTLTADVVVTEVDAC